MFPPMNLLIPEKSTSIFPLVTSLDIFFFMEMVFSCDGLLERAWAYK